MNLIISFSARTTGNCGEVAKYIFTPGDKLVHFKDLNVHCCNNCEYECFNDACKFRDDDMYALYDSMQKYDKVILIVPMYCGNPSSLYFTFTERSQDYFFHNDETYKIIEEKLYIIGIYGSRKESPCFLAHFEQWFDSQSPTHHVLGIERHEFNQRMADSVLDLAVVRNEIKSFVK